MQNLVNRFVLNSLHNTYVFHRLDESHRFFFSLVGFLVILLYCNSMWSEIVIFRILLGSAAPLLALKLPSERRRQPSPLFYCCRRCICRFNAVPSSVNPLFVALILLFCSCSLFRLSAPFLFVIVAGSTLFFRSSLLALLLFNSSRVYSRPRTFLCWTSLSNLLRNKHFFRSAEKTEF